jgi:uncharacterized SAM-binding protein YcdF (DUF218 family)
MFILKKILEAFLLPPGFVVLALGGLGLYLRRREKKAAGVCWALGALIWVGTTHIFADAMLRPLENAYARPEKPVGDVVVMLCAGARDLPGVYSASENLLSHTLERAAVAAQIYRNTGLPIIITGGNPLTRMPEAEAAARWLQEAGVPAKAILLDTAARDTIESAANVKKICAGKGYKKITLLTFAYHMPRALLLFSRAGLADIQPFPVARRTEPAPARHLTDYLPGASLDAREALNEYLGLAVYRLYTRAPKS